MPGEVKRCDSCGQELRRSKEYAGEYIATEYYGFHFCSSIFEICRNSFAIKLWEAAQARKQAERKTESTSPEASEGQRKLVEDLTGKVDSSHLRDMR